ncbi:MAG: hypothetical protein AB7Q97_23985 [Gammaproteobacteria bacterium]
MSVPSARPPGLGQPRMGAFRRRIRIVTSPAMARADLEDDMHRYGAIVRHDGRRVTAVEGVAIRTPWSLCGAAADHLHALAGMELSPDPLAAYAFTNGRRQCTHMFDMAAFAIAHAARGTPRRQYDAEIVLLPGDAPRPARLERNGLRILEWAVHGDVLTAPPALAGRNLRRLLEGNPLDAMALDDYEAMVVLRRAIYISQSRELDLDLAATAADVPGSERILGACSVYQAGVADRALRVRGASRDFHDRREAMLADLESPAP